METLCPRDYKFSFSVHSPGNHHSTFCHYGLNTVGTSYKWNPMEFVLLWLAYITDYNVLGILTCYSTYQNRLPFYSWMILRCMYMPHCVYPFIINEYLDRFHLLVIINTVALNRSVGIFLESLLSNYLGYMPRSGILDHMVILLNFLRSQHTVFHRGGPMSHSHQQGTDIPISSRVCHPDGCEVVSRWHCPND